MPTFDSVFEAMLAKKIVVRKEEEEARLTEGHAADFPEYRFRTGVIVGLKVALDAMQIVHEEIFEGDKPK